MKKLQGVINEDSAYVVNAALREKCLNTEFFPVRIFVYLE